MQVKKAIEQGNHDVARIHAENAIRQKNQSANFLKLASRMDAIVQRLQAAEATKTMSKSMAKVSKLMGSAIKDMNVEKISTTMDEFEKNFEELDVQSSVIESTVQQSSSLVMPEEQVQNLMKEVADEHSLEYTDKPAVIAAAARAKVEEKDDLEERLKNLK